MHMDLAQYWDTLRGFLLVLPPIIFWHELGHFLVARWCGVRVIRFSLGFGPKVFSVTRGGTEYQLAWVPLGGFVKMAGDSPESEDLTHAPDEFLSQVWWKKSLIAIAGPASNLVLAYVALVVMFRTGGKVPDFPSVLARMAQDSYARQIGLRAGDEVTSVDGQAVHSWRGLRSRLLESPPGKVSAHRVDYLRAGQAEAVVVPDSAVGKFLEGVDPLHPAVVGVASPGLPAWTAGLKSGDQIVAVDGRPIREWKDLTDVITVSAGKPLKLRVQRGARQLDITVTPQSAEEGGKSARIGIEAGTNLSYNIPGVDWGTALRQSWPSVWSMVTDTYAGFWKLLTHPRQISSQVGGPLLISQLAGQEARRGLADLLSFGAFISIAVMAFNLLPIPILDGGHVAFSVVEAIQRKPLSVGQMVMAQRVGLALLGSLLIFVLLNDAWRNVQRARNMSAGESRSRSVTHESP